jgi:hypothetical protein
MRRPFFVLWLLGALGGPAHAACDTGLAERMHAKLHPGRTLDHELAVCEPWRGVPGRSIVALPMPHPDAFPGMPNHGRYDLEVLVVEQADNGNTERTKIVSRRLDVGALRSDAIQIAEIRADTARYTLAPGARAFGLRVLYRDSSGPSPYAHETLTLYLPQGAKLAKLLDPLEMRHERGEWDGNCAGDFRMTHAALSVQRAANNGLADLMLRRTHSDSRSFLQGSECVTRERPATFDSILLRYDGASYHARKAQD